MRYDNYKSSGIEWLGDVPNHWSVQRIKNTIIKIGSGVTPKGGSEVYVSSGIPLLRSQNVYDDGLRIDDVSFIDEEIHSKMKSSQLKPNDILINITGASIGRTCIVPNSIPRANINQHIIFLRLKGKLVPYVSNYFKTNSVKEYINLIQAGTSKEALNMGQTLNIPIILPPLSEQTAIAQYLDTKTQAIDKKINLLTKKAATYKELRKSIINDAVCKGLDKNVKLKESGIEWIGKIPEHWKVERLKAFAKTVKGRNLEFFDKPFEKSLPILSLDYLRNENVEFVNYCYTKDKSQLVDENDFIIIWDGAGVGEILKGKKGFISSTTAKFVFNKKMYSKFFFHLRDSIEYTLKQIPTGMGIPHLNPQVLNNFPCPVPPKEEQTAIAKYLDEKTQKIDAIVSNIGKQIDTLKELRKTLINDVVTGKIKVTANGNK